MYRPVAVCVSVASLLTISASQLAAENAAKVDSLFAKWNKPNLPGAAVGIVRDGKLIYRKGFGSANLDYEVPNTPRTIFEIGSFGKAFTSLAIALLMDQGRVSPDDDIRRYVPEMHPFDPPIRVRHLVRCHSGLWAQWHIMVLAGWDNMPIQSPYTEDDLLTVLSGQKKLPFEPGKKFQYGSGDFFLLGLIVRRVTGKSLAAFSQENIFKPLGMKHTHIEEDPSRVVKHRAVGHTRERNRPWRLWTNHGYLAGGSGVKTSVEDLYRFDQNFDSNRLPRGKYVDEFFREGTLLGNRFCLDADAYLAKTNPKHAPPAGEYRGLKRIQFTGGVFGMASAMARFPQQKFTVICLSNTDEISPWKKARQIAELYLADKMKPKAAKKPARPKKAAKLSLEQLRDKVGVYRSKDGVLFRVTLKDGKLWNTNPRGETYELKPLSPTLFQPTFYPDDTFVFVRSSPREPFELKLEYDGGVLPFRRVKLVDPAKLDLNDYAGEYYSDELATTYRLRVNDKSLWLRVNARRWERLEPTLRDEFIPHKRHGHEDRRIRFRRDKSGRIVGLVISFWRIKGVEFVKRG